MRAPSPSAPALAEAWLELPDGRMFWLTGRCTLGRSADNDVVLPSTSVSRYHALIATDSAGRFASDLQSSNGTYVNRTPVTRPTLLRDGDEVRLGDITLRYRCTRPAGVEPANTLSERTRRLNDVRERACSLLLADVAGFSALNVELGGKVALQRFQAWIAGMRPLLETNGAQINSYVGDAIFAWWPADAAEDRAPVRRALAAIEAWRRHSPVPFRFVVHHGAVLFTRSERGEELSGQEVNFVFRAEKIAKGFGADAMLSEAAVRALDLDGACAELGAAPVDGIPGRFTFFGAPRNR